MSGCNPFCHYSTLRGPSCLPKNTVTKLCRSMRGILEVSVEYRTFLSQQHLCSLNSELFVPKTLVRFKVSLIACRPIIVFLVHTLSLNKIKCYRYFLTTLVLARYHVVLLCYLYTSCVFCGFFQTPLFGAMAQCRMKLPGYFRLAETLMAGRKNLPINRLFSLFRITSCCEMLMARAPLRAPYQHFLSPLPLPFPPSLLRARPPSCHSPSLHNSHSPSVPSSLPLSDRLPFSRFFFGRAVESANVGNTPFGNPLSPAVSPVRSTTVSPNRTPPGASSSSLPSRNGGGSGNLNTFSFDDRRGSPGRTGAGVSPTKSPHRGGVWQVWLGGCSWKGFCVFWEVLGGF